MGSKKNKGADMKLKPPAYDSSVSGSGSAEFQNQLISSQIHEKSSIDSKIRVLSNYPRWCSKIRKLKPYKIFFNNFNEE